MPERPLHHRVDGSGPFVLLISGLGGVGSFWAPQVRALQERFTVVTYDQRGTGASPRTDPPYTLAAMAQDALGLMDSLGAPDFAVVGHSTGGAIAQWLASRNPTRINKLVLSASWLKPDPYFRSLFELRKAIALQGGADLYQRLGTFLLYPATWIAQHRGELDAAEKKPIDLEVLCARIDALLAHDGTPLAPGIVCPTRVLCSKDDAVAPLHLSQELAGAIAQSRLSTFEWGGHYIQHTAAQQYNRMLLDFLLEERGG